LPSTTGWQSTAPAFSGYVDLTAFEYFGLWMPVDALLSNGQVDCHHLLDRRRYRTSSLPDIRA